MNSNRYLNDANPDAKLARKEIPFNYTMLIKE